MHDFRQLIYLVSLLLFLWSADCASSDGVLEINQACAVNTGCFTGDSPGFPVSTASSGANSFILTSNLNVGDVDDTGILLSENSTLDLNGFMIQGPITCILLGVIIDCDLDGAGTGISGDFNTTVKNGTVKGFGLVGIRLSGGTVGNVTAIRNNGTGIFLGQSGVVSPDGYLVSESHAVGNNGDGISMARGVVKDSVANGNGSIGFRLNLGGSLQGSTSMNNGGAGISVGEGVGDDETTFELVSNNTSTNNGGVGIIGGDGVHIRDNLVSENGGDGIQVRIGGLISGNTVFSNGGHGIHVNSSNLVINNAMRGNTGFGLFFVGSQSNYHGNMMSINSGGNVGGTGSGLNSGLNSCGNSTTCP